MIKFTLKSAGYIAGACAILNAGRALAGSAGVVVGLAVILITIPVLGFTLNQMTLTNKGRKVAANVDDVQLLKQSDAMAFTQPFAAVLRKLPTRLVYGDKQTPASRAIKMDGYVDPDARAIVPDSPPGQPVTKTFWESLTIAEQQALARAAQFETFDAGFVLWRQGQLADSVIVIRSGQVSVYVENAAGKRLIASRGPGDILGERAALRKGKRSATNIAVTAVDALVIRTDDFAVVSASHPRIVTVLENQVYDRLTEDQPTRLTADEVARALMELSGVIHSPRLWTGQNCSICLTDITSYSASFRNDRDRMMIRQVMYRMLADAFNNCGIPWHACHREDRGDGALIIVPPGIPTRLVVDAVAIRLAMALKHYNQNAGDAVRIQLRAAIHVGPVTTDPEGISGFAINQAARFVEAPPLKRGIAENCADLGLVTSQFVYETVVSQTADLIAPAKYRKINFQIKKSRNVAWMYLADSTERAAAS